MISLLVFGAEQGFAALFLSLDVLVSKELKPRAAQPEWRRV